MTELSASEIAAFPLVPCGRWWTGLDSQRLMLDVYHDTVPACGLAMSWDNGYGGKQFGFFPPRVSKLDFMLHLLDIPVAYRNAYEMLVENVACRAYLDVDYEGPADPDHNTLKRLMSTIRAKIRQDFQCEPKLYVCCGTRPSKDEPDTVMKHSYHIVCENLVFERNNDGLMRSFFTSIQGFTYQKDFEEKSMIDGSVYTKNRHFRTLHSCKRGTTTPLLRISGDPLLDEFTHDWGRDALATLPFFISNPDTHECTFVATPAPLLLQIETNKKSKRHKGDTPMNTAAGGVAAKSFPVPIQMLQELLTLAGDTTTTLGSVQYLGAEDKWQIQGNQRGQGRKCLVTPGTTHERNNCLLFVEDFKHAHYDGFKVDYFCTASECSTGCTKPTIGYIAWNVQVKNWAIQLSLPQADTVMHEEEDDDDSADMDIPEESQPVPPAPAPIDPEDPETNTYDMVKARFELGCFKVKHPFYYARIEEGHDPYLHSHIDLQHFYCDLKYWGNNKNDELVKLPFVPAWLQDPSKRMVERIVVDPTNSIKGVYNMWKGFAVEKIPPVDDVLVPELVSNITRHISDVITAGEDTHTMFVHCYLANMIQRPWLKSQVALSLYGAQGCGKGILFEFFRMKILGTHCSYQTARPEHDLFGRFANGAVNKVCVQVDEVKSLHEHADQLKDFITNPTINYEKKGKDVIVIANLANLILTSNNANALTVSPDDRRFVLFNCSSVHKNNAQYFTSLGAHLERPEVARAYYQYLMSLDLSAYPVSFQCSRPITQYYTESQHNSIPTISRFFSALVNSAYPEPQIPCRELYKKYELFHAHGNYKFLMTETAFGRDAKKYAGVTFHRLSGCRNYRFNHDEIKKYLLANNEYDQDAEY